MKREMRELQGLKKWALMIGKLLRGKQHRWEDKGPLEIGKHEEGRTKCR